MPPVFFNQLPCDGEGVCMVCHSPPWEGETLTCNLCVTPWHACCLITLPDDLDTWECPDCACPDVIDDGPSSSDRLMAEIQAIESDPMLSEAEKTRRREELMIREAEAPGNRNGRRMIINPFDGDEDNMDDYNEQAVEEEEEEEEDGVDDDVGPEAAAGNRDAEVEEDNSEAPASKRAKVERSAGNEAADDQKNKP